MVYSMSSCSQPTISRCLSSDRYIWSLWTIRSNGDRPKCQHSTFAVRLATLLPSRSLLDRSPDIISHHSIPIDEDHKWIHRAPKRNYKWLHRVPASFSYWHHFQRFNQGHKMGKYCWLSTTTRDWKTFLGWYHSTRKCRPVRPIGGIWKPFKEVYRVWQHDS